jgi:heavy metal sensor kinase
MTVTVPRSIRLRLTLWYVLILAVLLASFSAGVYLILRHNMYDNLDDSIRGRAGTLLEVLSYERGRPTFAGRVSPDSNAGENFTRVFDASGEVTFDNSAAAGNVPVDPQATSRALRGTTAIRTVVVGDDPMRVWTLPIRIDGGIVGVLEIGQSQEDLNETLQALLLIIAVVYPVTLGVASIGGVFLASRALSPIDTLTRLARRISAEDLGQRLDMSHPDDEVGRLASTLDEMIARLDNAFRRQRQFTADASHELRTPLTVIEGQIEVALQRERDNETYRRVLQTAKREVDRMIRMVGSLLTLARADAGQITISKDVVDLSDLVSATVEQVRPLADQKQLALTLEPAPNTFLEADEDLLLQVLLSLLDNAFKYTPSGGGVSVGWRKEGGDTEVWVKDTGAGIPDEHIQHVFDRFYRVDAARSEDTSSAGLGLSICRWIVEAHGGSISVESTPGEGSTFIARLPTSSR